MAYIGNSPANIGNYQIVDDISSSFNASTTSFALASGGITITPAKSGQILANINGVMQQPDDTGTNGFKVSGSNIVFSSAPASGDTFWAVYQGQNVDIGTPSDDVVDTAHIKDNAITAAKIADGTVVAAEIADNAVTTAKINADAVTGAKIADDAIDSEHYADGSIDNAHLADDAVGVAELSATGTASSSTFLRGDNSWQSAADATKLPLAGGTMTGNLAYVNMTTGDSTSTTNKIRMGAGSDLVIHHDGANSYIEDTGTGALRILGSQIEFRNPADSEAMMIGAENGATTLYHDNSAKLATSATGVTVTGAIAGATNLGKILQVKSGHQASAYTYSANSWHDVLLLTLDITPSATSSKILIQVDLNIGTTGTATGGNLYGHGRVLRDSTAIGLGNSAGNAQQQVGWSISNQYGYTKINTPSWHYLDSPNTTSEVTYKVQIWGQDVITLNRSGENNSHASVGRTSSNLTIMEIGA